MSLKEQNLPFQIHPLEKLIVKTPNHTKTS